MYRKFKFCVLAASLILTYALVGCSNKGNQESQNQSSTVGNQSISSSSETQADELKSSAYIDEKEAEPYKDIIEKHRKFIAVISEGNLNDEWIEDPWANLRSQFLYFKHEGRNLKKEACYALKDLNNNGKPELILLLDNYTIQAIYTLDNTFNIPKLLIDFGERHQGYLIPGYGDSIGICSVSSDGAGHQEMVLSNIEEVYSGNTSGLLEDERYTYDESKSGKTYPHYTVDTEFKEYKTHYFYSNVEQTDPKPITEQDYKIALEKYETTDQTKKVGLELKHLFN